MLSIEMFEILYHGYRKSRGRRQGDIVGLKLIDNQSEVEWQLLISSESMIKRNFLMNEKMNE